MDQQTNEKVNKSGQPSQIMQMIVIIGVLTLLAILAFALYKKQSVYTSSEVVTTWDRGDNTSVYYHMMSKGMLRYSKDGAALADQKGTIRWNQTYEMAMPGFSAQDDYAVIGDLGGNAIYVFDDAGCTGHLETDMPIQSIAISGQGVVAAVLTGSEGCFINLYDKEGKQLISIKATMDNTGYPLGIGLSPDATKMTVTYISMSSGELRTKAIFYDFSNVNSEHVLGTQELEGLYPRVIYLDNARIALVGEDGFRIYSAGSELTELQETSFDTEILGLFYESQKMGFVFRNHDENGKYRLEIYDLAGKQNLALHFDMDYKGLVADDTEIIIYDDDEVEVFTSNGHLKYHETFATDIVAVMPAWENNCYWIVDDQELIQLRIK